jgi:hypothetical protein
MMIFVYDLDATKTVLGLFGFGRIVYGMPRKNRKGNGIRNCMKKKQKIFVQMMLYKVIQIVYR